MSVPIRALILTAALAATLSACNRDREDARDPLPPAKGDASGQVTPADAAAPMTYESKTPFADVTLTLPDRVKAQADLHARLYSTAVRDLRQFVEGAQADRTEAGGDGGMQPYEKTITFDGVVETGKLFSLARSDFEYTGGAHGMTSYAGVLWDKALKRPVAAVDLFRPGSDLSALDTALCAAVNTARRERDPKAAPLTLVGGDWSCPKASAIPFVLTPGTMPGKAGGLTFLIGPYLVGPYSEGSYEVVVPQTALRALLAPAYAEEFAGEPVKPAAPATPA